MSEDMLGRISLSELRGLRDQVEDRLVGKKNEIFIRELKKWLRQEPCWVKWSYTLFYFSVSVVEKSPTLGDFYKRLRRTKFIERALSLNSEVVQNWLKCPSSYPGEFKNRTVCLFGSQKGSGDSLRIAALRWDSRYGYQDRILVFWFPLDYTIVPDFYPALLLNLP